MRHLNQDRVKFGPFEADLRTRELWKFGTRIKLVGQPFSILEVLIARPGDLVTREELRTQLWPGDTFVDFNHGLNAAVNKLRDALNDSADAPKYIETLPRRGYRFIATVEREQEKVEAADANAPATPVATEQELAPVAAKAVEPDSVETVAVPPPRRRFRALKLLFGLAFGLLGLLVVSSVLHVSLRHENESYRADPFDRAIPLTGSTEPTSDPAFSPDGNQIAFRRMGQGAGLYVKRIGTGEVIQLTRDSRDCCPEWSPDGRDVAFSRITDSRYEIRKISAEGGTEQELYSSSNRPTHADISWSPDGKTIAFVGGSGAGSIFLLNIGSKQVSRISNTPPGASDWGPTFSPDGQSIVFVRTNSTGINQDIMAIPGAGGEAKLVVSERTQIYGPPAWSSDSQSIIYSTARTGEPSLWRINLSGGTPERLGANRAWHPATSRRGFRLAYQEMVEASSIWKFDSSGQGTVQRLIATKGKNEGPQLSPDGKHIAFMSDRSGSMEIWSADVDGKNAIQLTAMNGAGTPRWSPDGTKIAFDSRVDDHGAVFVMDANGGSSHAFSRGNFETLVPSWSHNGRWIYFSSDRSGDWQIWKQLADGGPPVQVTNQGGFAPLESPDGRYLYYAKSRFPNPEIWRVPIEGGQEIRISPVLRPGSWASWGIASDGIYLVEEGPGGSPVLSKFDFSSNQLRTLRTLERFPFWMSVAPDGSSILFEQSAEQESTIMLVENFR